MPKIAIVGAGPGGLAAAMLLRQAGCSVTVWERHDRVGGRTASIGDDRFTFDLGPTFFLYPRVLEEVFAACGRDLRHEVQLIQLDPQYRLIFENGGQLDATPDVARMERELARLSPDDSRRLRQYLQDNRDKLEAFRPILESPFNSVFDLLRPSLLRAALKLRPHRSVDGDLGRFFSDPRIRLAFSFQSKYLGMSPFQCPSLFTILSYLEYEHGVWHPVGGCSAITQAMARICREMGVEIRLSEGVDGLLFEGRNAVGVRTASGEHRTDAVVVNADFSHAMTRLVPDHLRRRWTDRKIAGKRFSCSTFMMYLGIEGSYPNLEHHTIWLAADYEENIRDIEQRRRPCENPSFYIQNACRTDPSLAPAGHSTLYCLAPVAHQCEHVDWNVEKERYRALMLRQLEKIGLKDVERRIQYERVITPLDWEQSYHIYRGATFNLAHNLGQMLHLRPHNRFEDLGRVYLVGGGTHPGSGLPVIFESARISARLLLQDFQMPICWPGQTGEVTKYCQPSSARPEARSAVPEAV